MGRTNPTFRDLLGGIRSRWEDYRRALRRRDQQYFDELFAAATEYADASGYMNHDDPIIPVLFSMLLAQQKRLDELEEQLENEE